MKIPTPTKEVDKSQTEDTSDTVPNVQASRLKSLQKADHVRFVNRLEAFRKERGWSVAKLARHLGAQRVTLCRWLHGQQHSRASMRRLLSRRVSYFQPNYEPVARALRRYGRLQLSSFDRRFKVAFELFTWLRGFGFRVSVASGSPSEYVVIRVQPNKTTVFWLHVVDDNGRCGLVISRYPVDQTEPEEQVAGVLTVGVMGEFLGLLLSMREPCNEKLWPELPRGDFGQPWIPPLPDYQSILTETLKRDRGLGF